MAGRETMPHRQRNAIPSCSSPLGGRVPRHKIKEQPSAKDSRQRHLILHHDFSVWDPQAQNGGGPAQQSPRIHLVPFGTHRHSVHRSGTPSVRIRKDDRHHRLHLRLRHRLHAHVQRPPLAQRRDRRRGHRHTLCSNRLQAATS